MENNNSGRKKNVTNNSKGVHKRGEGLGTGPVGKSDGYSGRTGSVGSSGSKANSGKKSNPLAIIAVIIIALVGGGLSSLFGGGSGSGGGNVTSLFGGFSGSSPSAGWTNGNNTGKLNTNVSSQAQAKRTNIIGNGNDVITIMVYMCGTDLESKYGMATNDMNEMLKASLNKNINIIIYTGGCKTWKTKGISNQVNQIYRVADGKLELLVADDGSKVMTKPDTLTNFIKYCSSNYPANRNELIFWDHGGGSISGYGYDEKNAKAGSMDLSEIDTALKNAGMTFDFIGFDACLMATLETSLMVSNYADYMIASEETEPGIGWYYTDWLNALSKNTSMPTIEIGKNIVEGFVDECAKKCKGQQTTLSVIDLAELKATVPEKLSAFSTETGNTIKGDDYKKVSDARAGAREFATSSGIDQVDLVSLATNIGTQSSKDLANTLLECVKYNRTSSNMTNAYGISIYFPYRNAKRVNNIATTYSRIGMDAEYTKCIKAFAGMEVSGQISSGGASSPLPSLTGGQGLVQTIGSEAISSLLSSFMSGRSVAGIDDENAEYMNDAEVFDVKSAADYIANNQFDSSLLLWKKEDGKHLMSIPKEQWSFIQSLQMNMFYDDGEGYIDLGLDNVYDFTEDGKLIGDSDHTWLAIDGQPVAYYFESEVKEGNSQAIIGRVPVMLNDERANLILVFDDEHPYGFIAGARYDYIAGETETIAKGITELSEGDKIDFVCDYYSYDGTYLDSYFLGDQVSYSSSMEISNVDVGGESMITYLLTDIYEQEYWTPVVPN